MKVNNNIVGVYTSEPPNGEDFFGEGENFIFSLYPERRKLSWIGKMSGKQDFGFSSTPQGNELFFETHDPEEKGHKYLPCEKFLLQVLNEDRTQFKRDVECFTLSNFYWY